MTPVDRRASVIALGTSVLGTAGAGALGLGT
ncbi:MAG: hypothetical protein JWO60_2238, partial [Frankiales bacterium]|nr:hypothetical protein [Frankiales bacterium]